MKSLKGNKCFYCNKEFLGHFNKKFCSEKCKDKHRIEKNNKKYTDPDDFVVCKICGAKGKNIQNHLYKRHKLKLYEYYEKYNCDKNDVFSKNYLKKLSDNVKGEKNPGYGDHRSVIGRHGEEKKLEIIKKSLETKKKNNSNNTTLEYYLKKGLSLKKAKEALSERQSTFSLKKLIKKYGKEKGTKIWEKRQEKWLKSYYNKTEEEIKDINYRKTKFWRNNTQYKYSEISKQFFKEIDNKIKYKCYYAENEKYIKKYRVDFFIKELNLIIEFFGDYWHANPKIYSEDHIFNFPSGQTSYKEIHKNDLERINFLKKSGYKVIVVWENEHKEILNNLKEFINEMVN
jgi:very-short-patch-repair endonuclease